MTTISFGKAAIKAAAGLIDPGIYACQITSVVPKQNLTKGSTTLMIQMTTEDGEIFNVPALVASRVQSSLLAHGMQLVADLLTAGNKPIEGFSTVNDVTAALVGIKAQLTIAHQTEQGNIRILVSRVEPISAAPSASA